MSTAIEIRFLAGRYHATPWNRHVNESDVEWPPSPLRLLRALIAVWHRKADRDQFTEEVLKDLVYRFSAERPVYALPPASLAHTRHYMPTRSGKAEKTTLVFDGFLRVDPDDPLTVVWPSTNLTREAAELLDHLLERLGYLGRAESWVEARRVETWSALPNSCPEDSHESPWDTVEAREQPVQPVKLPVPLTPEAYSAWQREQITTLGLEKPRLVREKRLRATLPDGLLDALRLDTGDWRDAGWNRMPGTEEATYLRPEDCFAASRARRYTRRGRDRRVTTVRLALIRIPGRSSDGSPVGASPLPRLEDAVKIGEVARLAAIGAADGGPPVLSGHNMPDGAVHEHAFYLPEDSDEDGRIDHLLVHAPAGFGSDALDALGRIERLWVDGGAEWRVVLESYGAREEFDGHPYLSPATTWTSVTPYLHPWFRKASFTVEDQIRRELSLRGVAEPFIDQLAHVRIRDRKRRSVHFHRFRRRRDLTQPDTKGSFQRLRFPEPVAGPLALGFGCHYGLGIFAGEGGGPNA